MWFQTKVGIYDFMGVLYLSPIYLSSRIKISQLLIGMYISSRRAQKNGLYKRRAMCVGTTHQSRT
jgi:hypothetical protein